MQPLLRIQYLVIPVWEEPKLSNAVWGCLVSGWLKGCHITHESSIRPVGSFWVAIPGNLQRAQGGWEGLCECLWGG